MEIGNPARVVLRPVPEREGRLARDLRLQRPLVEVRGRIDRMRVEQENRERDRGRHEKARREREGGSRPRQRVWIGEPERRDDERRELRPPGNATATPRAQAELTSQKPQMRNTGTIESFVFDIDTYCVKGYAAQANANAAASHGPPNRKPTRPSPSRQRTSKRIEVRWTAGRSSHFPDQPRIQ